MKRLIIAFACLLTVFSLTAKADFPDFTSLVKQAAPAVVHYQSAAALSQGLYGQTISASARHESDPEKRPPESRCPYRQSRRAA